MINTFKIPVARLARHNVQGIHQKQGLMFNIWAVHKTASTTLFENLWTHVQNETGMPRTIEIELDLGPGGRLSLKIRDSDKALGYLSTKLIYKCPSCFKDVVLALYSIC